MGVVNDRLTVVPLLEVPSARPRHDAGLSIVEVALGLVLGLPRMGPSCPPTLLILNRHRASSFVVTSNRTVDEWLSLFDDPILGNSALDRLANASYQIVIEGASYRERLSPHRAFVAQGGD